MASVDVITSAGKSAGKADLDDQIFGIEPNIPLMHQVVTAQLAARRAGTHSTKTRAERRGGGAKPWRQKGTGRARQGSIRSPQWRGGGVAHGPKPRDYSQKTPKKMIKQALRCALSDRAADGKVMVVDDFAFDAPKTKDAIAALKAIGAEGRVLLVLTADDANAALSFRNLPEVHVLPTGELNAYDVLVSDLVVFTKDALPTADAPAKAEKPAKAAKAEKPAKAVAEEVTPTEASSDEADFGPDSHAPIDGDAMPDGFPVKGNADSMKFHQPGGRWYDSTVAEVWFTTAEAATAAGFTEAGTKASSEEE